MVVHRIRCAQRLAVLLPTNSVAVSLGTARGLGSAHRDVKENPRHLYSHTASPRCAIRDRCTPSMGSRRHFRGHRRLVERAMCEPGARPGALELGELLQRVQVDRGPVSDRMALRDPQGSAPSSRGSADTWGVKQPGARPGALELGELLQRVQVRSGTGVRSDGVA